MDKYCYNVPLSLINLWCLITALSVTSQTQSFASGDVPIGLLDDKCSYQSDDVPDDVASKRTLKQKMDVAAQQYVMELIGYPIKHCSCVTSKF